MSSRSVHKDESIERLHATSIHHKVTKNDTVPPHILQTPQCDCSSLPKGKIQHGTRVKA